MNLLQKKSGNGVCHFCRKPVAATAIGPHLERHLDQICEPPYSELPYQTQRYIHVAVSHSNKRYFWINLLINAESEMVTLDSFIRSTWVDCCNHDSHMDFRDRIVTGPTSDTIGLKASSWHVSHHTPVIVACPPGCRGTYSYDHRNETLLRIEIKEMYRIRASEPAMLMARNEPPPCARCAKPAATWPNNGKSLRTRPLYPYCLKCRPQANVTDEPTLIEINNTPRPTDTGCFNNDRLTIPPNVASCSTLIRIPRGEN